MSHNIRYHRVSADDRDTEHSRSRDETQRYTPASVSWTALLLVWLLTVLVTALITTAVTSHSQSECSSSVRSTALYSDASSPIASLCNDLPPSHFSTNVSNTNIASHSSSLPVVDRSPCRPLPVVAATPIPPPSTYLPPAYHTAPHTVWSDLPSLSLLVRTYSTNWNEVLHLLFTHSIFWPRTYTHSGVVFVLDEERASDRRLGTLLLHSYDGGGDRLTTPSHVSVVYEAMPGRGILSDKWRGSIGYCRQQYSNFYSDMYTDREYVGIVDSDAYFIRPPNPDDVFERVSTTHNSSTDTTNTTYTYRPILIGYNGNTLWCTSAEYMVGRSCAGEFMINFPVTIKRTHFARMRQHIVAHLNVSSFEVAWRRMLTDVGDNHKYEYSQFTIMATYLWHFHHDEYAWRINSMRNKRHKRLSRLLYDTQNTSAMTHSPAYHSMATRMAQYDKPTARYVQHPFKTTSKLTDIYHSLCVASNFLAGDCTTHDVLTRRRMQLTAWQQWWTDEEPEVERQWVSERYPSVESNTNAVINNMAVYYAGQWRRYQWPADARQAAGEVASGMGGVDGLSGCVRDSGSSGRPYIYRPHRVSYNASDGTFHEPTET